VFKTQVFNSSFTHAYLYLLLNETSNPHLNASYFAVRWDLGNATFYAGLYANSNLGPIWTTGLVNLTYPQPEYMRVMLTFIPYYVPQGHYTIYLWAQTTPIVDHQYLPNIVQIPNP
jgi:hypothetical protein